MALARDIQRNPALIYLALLVTLGALVALSPAEATLGNVVKLVYLHGAFERISVLGYLTAGVGGLVFLITQRPGLARWVRALMETGIVFWLAQFLISLPAQILSWGAIVWDEPRVAGALWIIVLTLLTYAIARWIGETNWVAMAAIANAALVTIILRGEVNIVHPPNAILASDSLEMKLFYGAIVLAIGMIAFQFARDRAM